FRREAASEFGARGRYRDVTSSCARRTHGALRRRRDLRRGGARLSWQSPSSDGYPRAAERPGPHHHTVPGARPVGCNQQDQSCNPALARSHLSQRARTRDDLCARVLPAGRQEIDVVFFEALLACALRTAQLGHRAGRPRLASGGSRYVTTFARCTAACIAQTASRVARRNAVAGSRRMARPKEKQEEKEVAVLMAMRPGMTAGNAAAITRNVSWREASA